LFFRVSDLVFLLITLLHFIVVITLSLRLFASIFAPSRFLSIASLSSSFTDGINVAVMHVSYHLTSAFGGARGKYTGACIAIIAKGCWHLRQLNTVGSSSALADVSCTSGAGASSNLRASASLGRLASKPK
jgi:hypothetical protein